MRKEVTIAILLGLGIGLLAVFGILTARSALTRYEQEKQVNQVALDAISPTPSVSDAASPAISSLTVTEPVDGSVASEDSVAVTGKAPRAEVVVITGETEQFIVETNSEGVFRQDVKLVSGENEVRLAAFFPGGERQDTRLTVVFTTADF